MKTLSRQDLHDILRGCAVLGTGGGGSLAKGLELVDAALDEGKVFRLATLEEAPDDAMAATPYMCGAVSPETEEERAKYAGLPRIAEDMALRAYRVMERHYGRDFYGVVSTELGGGNTAVALAAAARLGKVILDADPAGRSVPELQHSTYYLSGLSIAPIAVANEFGDEAVLSAVVNDFRAEALVRAMAVASKNSIGVADHPTTIKNVRGKVIHGAISGALAIGRALREALEAKADPAEAVARAGGGRVLFRGRIADLSLKTEAGFTLGELNLEGSGADRGSTYRLWFKNEHLASYRNGKVDVTVPDLICTIEEGTGEPLTNPNYAAGQELAIVGLPAPAPWRSPEGLAAFGPDYFKLGVPYRPLEDLPR